MTVSPFLIIVTVIFPGASGIFSFVTPGPTSTKVWDELPHVRVTVLVEVENTTAQRVSYIVMSTQITLFR